METVRELEKDEWPKLQALLDELQVPCPPQETSRIIVLEVDGEIKGWWMAVQVVHLEPVWIHHSVRSSSALSRMWKALTAILDACHVDTAFCFSDRPEISGYLDRLGFQPCRNFEIFLYEKAIDACHLSLPRPPSVPVEG